jgi:AcrR family transcriptional regulator
MPAPPKTSAKAIVAAASELIAEAGLDALTMQTVAARVGVRGPSLYKHFADRAALLRAVELTVVADLEQVIQAANQGEDKAALRSIASAYRHFASDSPERYRLLFQLQADDPETQSARWRALRPVLTRLEALLGNHELAFVRARALTAFVHGFVSMEMMGAFRMGGDPGEAFTAGVDLLLKRPKKS